MTTWQLPGDSLTTAYLLITPWRLPADCLTIWRLQRWLLAKKVEINNDDNYDENYSLRFYEAARSCAQPIKIIVFRNNFLLYLTFICFRLTFKRVSAGVFPRSLHQDASYCDRGIWWRYPELADQDSPDTLSYFLTWLCIARSSPRDTRDNLWWGHCIGTLKPMHWNVVVCCPSRAQKVCTVGGVKSACKDPSFAQSLVIFAN